jgi:hypothetical protein
VDVTTVVAGVVEPGTVESGTVENGEGGGRAVVGE